MCHILSHILKFLTSPLFSGTQTTAGEEEYVDEEALFEFPSLLVNMAEAMMLSPPRINSFPSEDYSSGDFDAESLWSY